MRVNVDRVLERDQKLTDLDNRAGEIVIWLLYALFCILMQDSLLHFYHLT